MKTLRRDKLRRMVEAGRMVMVDAYHYDEMEGEKRGGVDGKPVAMMPKDWSNRKEGFCYIHPFEFETSTGRAWLNENGTITLYVHSNCSYDMREVS